MNKLSFLDELLRCCSLAPIVKRAYAEQEVNTIDVPAGIMDADPTPPQLRVAPDEASTRTPAAAHVQPTIKPGLLGDVTDAKEPIDRERFNRVFDVPGAAQ